MSHKKLKFRTKNRTLKLYFKCDYIETTNNPVILLACKQFKDTFKHLLSRRQSLQLDFQPKYGYTPQVGWLYVRVVNVTCSKNVVKISVL